MPATHGDFTHRHGAGSEQLDFQSASGSVPASEQRASTLSADSPCYPKERPGFSAQRQEEPGTGQTIACFHLALAGGFHRKTCEPLSGLNLHLKSCFLGWGGGRSSLCCPIQADTVLMVTVQTGTQGAEWHSARPTPTPSGLEAGSRHHPAPGIPLAAWASKHERSDAIGTRQCPGNSLPSVTSAERQSVTSITMWAQMAKQDHHRQC